MKAITFLGASKAYETTYVMPDGREFTAPFFGVALARFYPGLDLRVFVTDDAAKTHLAEFRTKAEDYVGSLKPVHIADGRNEAELWSIFEAVVEAVHEGERVVFDLTHGFRSLPFLSFLAAAYLRTVKQVDLAAVLYGNFEARDRSVEPNRAPVIDMTAYVSLLDWIVAADRFIRFGDARDLAERLAQTKPNPETARADDFHQWKATGVSKLIRVLQEGSRALRLIRPYEVMEKSADLRDDLPLVLAQVTELARPLSPLANHISASFAPLALSRERREVDGVATLARERALIGWYLDRNQLVQATAVAREWLVSWVLHQLSAPPQDFLDHKRREAVARALGAQSQQRRGKELASEEDEQTNLPDPSILPNFDQILTMYEQLRDVRNDLLHAGKRAGALESEKLEERIRHVCRGLDELPLPAAGIE